MDRIVYVTGGANGLGKAIVTLFCKNGDDVTFCDIDKAAAENFAVSYLTLNAHFTKLIYQMQQPLSSRLAN